MTVASVKGRLDVALQKNGYVGRSGTLTPASEKYYPLPASNINVGTMTDQQIAPLEVGEGIFPRGPYRQGYAAAGQFDLIPRLENTFGQLLFSALGQTNVVADTPEAGAYKHIFRVNPVDSEWMPWVSYRRHIPGSSFQNGEGETFFDCKTAQLVFNAAAAGKLTSRVGFVGRDVIFGDGIDWANEVKFEDFQSTPDTNGYDAFVKINNTEYSVVGMTVTVANNLSTIQEERIVGDPRPDTFIRKSFAVSVRVVIKWADRDLCRLIQTGSTNGTNWTSLPLLHETQNGSHVAFEAKFVAPKIIPGTSTPYTIGFEADHVTWQMDGYPTLVGGDIVRAVYTGTVLLPTEDQHDYFRTYVINDKATAYSVDLTGGTPPVVTAGSGGTFDDNGAVAVDATATVADSDSTDFKDGYIMLTLGGADVKDDDVLTIVGETVGAGAVSAVGNRLFYNNPAVEIGAFIPGEGTKRSLIIKFSTADATVAAVEQTLQRVHFNRPSADTGPISETIKVKGIINDGDGGVTEFNLSDVSVIYS